MAFDQSGARRCFRVGDRSTLHWTECGSVQRWEMRSKTSDRVIVTTRKDGDSYCYFCTKSKVDIPELEERRQKRIGLDAVVHAVENSHYEIVWTPRKLHKQDMVESIDEDDNFVQRDMDEIKDD